MKESEKLERLKAALKKAPASTRSQRIKKDSELANLDRMIAKHIEREAAQCKESTAS
jgi:hypothetical protein